MLAAGALSRLPFAFFLAALAVLAVLVAVAVVLSPSGEPTLPREGSVRRTLERRASSQVEEDQ